uniref:Neuronal pentraxin receptor a n=1 Tax=Amphiprion percula TaxID=161767 RepID=A0A3P8RPB9_AMPPE
IGLDGVTGLTGHDPTVSRLICTPIPAGECNTKNFQQQADDPSLYAGEDWGYLRTTAEELRQTVLQQKDQIQTDQRTIRELTGKLSECEKGLDGKSGSSSSADRRGDAAAGLRGGKAAADREEHLERIMVRDSPASTHDSVHLLTVRAVDELEQAINQLKDRIEKLEVGKLRYYNINHLQRTRDRGDLEGELERKVELLEKERKALRLSFPTRTNYMYALVRHSIPKLRSFTACLWLRPAEGGIGTPLSYAVPDQPNELVLLQGLHSPAELLVNDKVTQLPLNLSRGSWQHVCVSWSQKGGVWQAYQGGKLRGEGHGLATGHHIRPGGELVLGQEQDSLGGGFDSSQALVGQLSQVGLWDRVLSSSQVATLARCGKVPQGSVAPWTENGIEVHGGATKDPGEPCSKHSRSSQ